MEGLLPDSTLFVQLGLFFATYFVLKHLVFIPYLDLLEERKAKTEGLRQKAAANRERAAELKKKYLEFMTEKRKTITHWLEDERRKIQDEERSIIQEARVEVSGQLDTLRAEIDREKTAVTLELMKEVPTFASQVASKLAGKEIKVSESMISSPRGSASSEGALRP